MGKRKAHLSLFSTIVQQINEHDRTSSSNECHLIDKEYFAAFDSLSDIQEFHSKIIEQQQQQQSLNTGKETNVHIEQEDQEMDMKSFAAQFLIDSPEQITKVTENQSLTATSSQDMFTRDQPINPSHNVKGGKNINQSPDNKKRKSTTPVKLNVQLANKRQRRNIRDLPQSSDFIFTFENNRQTSSNTMNNVSDCLQNENTNSILSNSSNQQSINNESTISNESSIIKNEPIQSDQRLLEPKEEPVEVNMTSIGAMSFGTSEFSGDLDNYVQNIHLLRQSSNNEDSNSIVSSRPKRIRKRKKLYIEESESITRPRKLKTPIRKKPSSALQLTDAEIEKQFGERLPVVKSENNDETQQHISSRIVIEFEPVSSAPQTPMEKARAKLTAALGRGHHPDTYLLKIRSREHKIIEVQLAIYGTADWHGQRTKILAKIEEALRGLRVSWTKIDITVDDFDIQISTSSQTAYITPPSSISNMNSSWFLKALSESGPLIVHIHDRRYPQQRFLIKCPCPECSFISTGHSIDSSLPVIVNVSPATTPTRRLTTPSILHKTSQSNISSSHNIATTFFNELIHQYGRNTVISVTQCVLDLALIVSVHASLPSLCVSPNYSKEEYKRKYQQIIDPLKCTLNENEKMLLSKSSMITRVVPVNGLNNTQSLVLSKTPDILTFYNSIHQNNANIRNAKSMRNLITTSFSTPVSPVSQSNLLKTQTLILPKPATTISLSNIPSTMNLIEFQRSHRRSLQTNRYDNYIRTYSDTNESKQRTLGTPIIELKPIMNGSTVTTQNIHSLKRENNETIVVRDSQNNELKKITTIKSINTGQIETQPINNETISSTNTNARIIRLSIAKSTLSEPQSQSTTSNVTTSPKNDVNTNSSHSILSSNTNETVPLIPKQINIIKSLSSTSTCLTPAIKLSNPVLIVNKSQLPTTK